MLKAKEINFTIEGAKGELKLIYQLFKRPRLIQDNEVIKPKGFFRKKYQIVTDKGNTEELEIRKNFQFVRIAKLNTTEHKLEENLSNLEYFIGLIPLFISALIGGLFGAFIGLFAVALNYTCMRLDKRIFMQILVSFITTMLCYLVYYKIAPCMALIIKNLC